MRKFLIVFLLFFLFSVKSNSQGCLTADMMILIDWSGSEQGNELELATAAMMFVSELPVNENQLRVGLITFSEDPSNIINLTGDKNFLINQIVTISLIEASGGTYINSSIDLAGDLLNNKRQDVRKIIIIISDGEIYDTEHSVLTCSVLKEKLPLSIFAVQIGGDKIDLQNLINLTGSPYNVEHSAPNGIVESLKRLNLCN